MTFSNGAFSPHPLANPFNTRLGPSNYSLNPLCGSLPKFNASRKDLPEPVMLGQSQEELHVPSREVPMRELLGAYEQKLAGMVWRDKDIFTLKMPQSQQGMSQEDIAYWKHAEEESQKLSASMTDFQKKMMAFADEVLPKSRLEEVDN